MSWLFSRALVVEYSVDFYWDGEPSVPSNMEPTQGMFLSHGRTTEPSDLSRYGMTCIPLTDDLGEDLLTSCLAASRANSPRPRLRDVTTQRTSGRKCSASSGKCARDLYCLRMSQGQCSLNVRPATTSSASATACADPSESAPSSAEHHTNAHAFGRLATPTATANQLAPSMAKWPGCRNLQRLALASGLPFPTLYEWMMGWPIGWTDLRPLAMDRFHEWLQQHGEPCEGDAPACGTSANGAAAQERDAPAGNMNERKTMPPGSHEGSGT